MNTRGRLRLRKSAVATRPDKIDESPQWAGTRRRPAQDGIAYVPYFPLGGLTPLQSTTLPDIAARLGTTPMQVALAWLLRRAPNIPAIPGTSSGAHLQENLAVAERVLPDDAVKELDHVVEAAAARSRVHIHFTKALFQANFKNSRAASVSRIIG